jgi:hypothetical protein
MKMAFKVRKPHYNPAGAKMGLLTNIWMHFVLIRMDGRNLGPEDKLQQSPPNPAIIASMRTTKSILWIADYMVRAVHEVWNTPLKAGSKSMMFGTFIPISQEAFALLLYKNR